MTNSPIDLSQLAVDRSPQGVTTADKPRRRRWLTRYVLPIAIFVGFAVLLGAAVGRHWLPAKSVTVLPVIVKQAEIQQAGTTLFQSPGWIEPRPTAINVAALAPGVIDELLVVEGEQVKKGDAIARLISIDAELNLEQSKTTLAIRDSEVYRAKAELDAAQIRFEKPVHLKVSLADAQATLAKAKTELAQLPFLITSAEAKAQNARSSMEGKRKARGVVSERVVDRSESEHAMAEADLQELRNRKPYLQREVDALTDKVDVIKQQLDLLVEETRRVQEATANLQAAQAKRDEAKLQVRRSELSLERNVVRAPINGRVLRLIAAPGSRVMGPSSSAGHSSSTVIEMYDPNRLQVRVNVRLEDIPMVTRDQTVEIETASSEGVIRGRVLQMTSTANIQKNTLEVKVELIDPPVTVRPEMLVEASFLAPATDQATSETSTTERIFVPTQLVQSDTSGEFVWIVDENNLAQRRFVDKGSPSAGGLTEIQSGLQVTDKLVVGGVQGLSSGTPVHVTGDDPSVGIH